MTEAYDKRTRLHLMKVIHRLYFTIVTLIFCVTTITIIIPIIYWIITGKNYLDIIQYIIEQTKNKL